MIGGRSGRGGEADLHEADEAFRDVGRVGVRLGGREGVGASKGLEEVGVLADVVLERRPTIPRGGRGASEDRQPFVAGGGGGSMLEWTATRAREGDSGGDKAGEGGGRSRSARSEEGEERGCERGRMEEGLDAARASHRRAAKGRETWGVVRGERLTHLGRSPRAMPRTKGWKRLRATSLLASFHSLSETPLLVGSPRVIPGLREAGGAPLVVEARRCCSETR